MKWLGELQSHIAEIRELNAEVIALSCGGNRRDVNQTRQRLGITYPMIPAPVAQVIKDYGPFTNQYGTSYGTAIIDKSGVVRFLNNSTTENTRTPIWQIQEVLKGIRQ